MTRACRRVLVTGAQGFTGRYLTRHWLAQDEAVRVIGVGRSPERTDTFAHRISWRGRSLDAPLPPALRPADPGRYVYQRVDLVETDAVARLLAQERVDTVVHLAASLRDEPFDLLVRNNIVALQSLCAAAVQAARADLRIVVCSSGSVYGRVPDEALPTTEDWPPTPVDLYAVTKRAGEDVASLYRRRHDLDVVIARIFNVIGAGEDERHLPPFLARQFAERRRAAATTPIAVGPLDTTRDLVDVNDVAVALVLIATHAAPGDVVNVASGIESPIQSVFDVLAELSGDSEAAIDRRPARRADVPRQWADIRRLKALGFTPKYTLRESLHAVLRYYLDDVAGAAERKPR